MDGGLTNIVSTLSASKSYLLESDGGIIIDEGMDQHLAEWHDFMASFASFVVSDVLLSEFFRGEDRARCALSTDILSKGPDTDSKNSCSLMDILIVIEYPGYCTCSHLWMCVVSWFAIRRLHCGVRDWNVWW